MTTKQIEALRNAQALLDFGIGTGELAESLGTLISVKSILDLLYAMKEEMDALRTVSVD